MRKVIGVIAIIAVLAVATWGVSGTRVRLSSQEYVTAYNTFHLVVDSTDTFAVDTVFSETLSVGDHKYLHYKTAVSGITIPDSANDSAEVIFQLFAGYSEFPWFDTLISADTPNMANGALDTTAYLRDSLVLTYTAFDQVWWRMIVSDSFISTGATDSVDVRIQIETVESEYVRR